MVVYYKTEYLDCYDYGARFYDPQIGRWSVPDVLGELREYESPFCYVGNNPVARLDPDGRWWKNEKEERKADKVTSHLEKTNDRIRNKIDKAQIKIDKATTSGNINRVNTLEGKKSNLSTRIDYNIMTIQAIGIIGRDPDRTFRFGNMVNTENGIISTYVTRDLDKTYVINSRGDIGSKAHEIIHGSQISQGHFDVGINGDLIMSRQDPIDREEPAYKAELAASGNIPYSTNGLNDKDFRKKTLDFLRMHENIYGPSDKK